MSTFENGFALVIGVANYPKVRRLPTTVLKDAQDMYDLLRSPSHCAYPVRNTRLLLDDQSTLENIHEGLRWLAQSATAHDTGLIFFSGHGGRLTSGPQAGNYLIPYDCDPEALSTTALAGQELTELLHQIKAQRLLVLFDACYSGGTSEAKDLMSRQPELKSGLDEHTYEQLAQGAGRVIMASSRSDETSLVLNNMRNSLFTHYLLEALRGNARTHGDGVLRIFDVFEYVSEQVPAHGNQHPIFKATDLENNFPIALFVGGKQLGPAADSIPLHKTAVDKRALREAMIQAFSLEDLELLCADVEQDLANDDIHIAVNLEMVKGSAKPGKILGLIEYLDNRAYLSYLVRAVRLHRPGIL